MTGTDAVEVHRKLDELDTAITELRQTIAALRRQVGGREDGPYDTADRVLLLTQAEEQEALLAALVRRREELQDKLRGT